MFEWCKNRLEITGRSVFVDIMQQWVTGEEVPLYRHAIQQSIRLFLAGCAGILKPVKCMEYPPFPRLVSHGTGSAVASNLAFQHWLDLLLKDAVLDGDTIRQIDRIYLQSGIASVKWETIPEGARQIITQLIARQYPDWFGVASWSSHINGADCWTKLGVMQEHACNCDMLMIIPTRLAIELNGNSPLLTGVSTTHDLYSHLYGMAWPSGQNIIWQRDRINSLRLDFDSPSYPPSAELMGELSAVFDCEIRHWYQEPVNGIRGYDCYDRGDHVDSGEYGAGPFLPPLKVEEVTVNGQEEAAV
ncbi:hypothetical protein BF17_02485 [Yersinia similis]|uniref:YubB ferredoxin-like domain-containing protein n=1 Tax=Yersinia similis TaxID=367190 RepID=A0ABN4CHW7_9GAMM|nr:DUF1281 domain-containing protein [Yersinia similis]AHK18360.1 hypothetical protein BF17_02485 [Yersinia similis]CFQ68311.1 Protein of uncharacterised function (DUF1281) [Yersinia similis]